jgi:hypothetical protein
VQHSAPVLAVSERLPLKRLRRGTKVSGKASGKASGKVVIGVPKQAKLRTIRHTSGVPARRNVNHPGPRWAPSPAAPLL